jgi:hypothetical protein
VVLLADLGSGHVLVGCFSGISFCFYGEQESGLSGLGTSGLTVPLPSKNPAREKDGGLSRGHTS